MHVKQGYLARLKLQMGQKIDVTTLIAPDLHENLLSMRDLIRSQG